MVFSLFPKISSICCALILVLSPLDWYLQRPTKLINPSWPNKLWTGLNYHPFIDSTHFDSFKFGQYAYARQLQREKDEYGRAEIFWEQWKINAQVGKSVGHAIGDNWNRIKLNQTKFIRKSVIRIAIYLLHPSFDLRFSSFVVNSPLLSLACSFGSWICFFRWSSFANNGTTWRPLQMSQRNKPWKFTNL